MSDFTFGAEEKTSPIKSILIGAICVLIGGGAWWYMNTRTITTLSVPKVQLYAAHTVFKSDPGSVHIVGEGSHTEDDLYVAVTLSVQNNISIPIFINSIDATYTAPDDSILETKAPGHADLDRLEQIFPDLVPLMADPLAIDATIPPHATSQGTVLLHFAGLSAQTWKTRKSAVITINLAHQPAETITIP